MDSRVEELVKSKACKHVASRERFISEKDTLIVYDMDERSYWV